MRALRFLQVTSALLVWVAVGSLSGCDRQKPEPRPEPAPKPPPLCPTGHSQDPSRAELEPGIRWFRDQEYSEATKRFAELAERYPKSATTLGWQADAILFDRDRDPDQAALDARPIQKEARRLHEAGCRLPRRPYYYLLMGEAYGALRLEKTGELPKPVAAEVKRALDALTEAAQAFPDSAEVAFNLARAHCAAAQVESMNGDHAEACVQQFGRSLDLAASLDRPRFLRTHRSVEDWLVRSETQSEFGPLRDDPRYRKLVAEAREKALEPVGGRELDFGGDQ